MKFTVTINTCWEAIQRFMAAKLTRLTHKIVIQLHLVAESCIICSSHSGQPVQKLLDTPLYILEMNVMRKRQVWGFGSGNNRAGSGETIHASLKSCNMNMT